MRFNPCRGSPIWWAHVKSYIFPPRFILCLHIWQQHICSTLVSILLKWTERSHVRLEERGLKLLFIWRRSSCSFRKRRVVVIVLLEKCMRVVSPLIIWHCDVKNIHIQGCVFLVLIKHHIIFDWSSATKHVWHTLKEKPLKIWRYFTGTSANAYSVCYATHDGSDNRY